MSQGSLVLVGTPLGNRQDLSPRAREAILSADVLWCEDTRSPLRLFGEGTVLPTRRSCFAGNEEQRCEELPDHLAAGERIVFVSEAGMPGISDPGQRLAEVAWRVGAGVEVVPGPTAAMTALVASGFAAQGAVFWGFLARKGARRDAQLSAMTQSQGAFVVYEAGSRVRALLADLARVLGDTAASRRLLIARELTKKHESLTRDTVANLAEAAGEMDLRGEFTLVLQGREPQADIQGDGPHDDPHQAGARAVWSLLQREDLKPKTKAREIAQLVGEPAREVYAVLVRDR